MAHVRILMNVLMGATAACSPRPAAVTPAPTLDARQQALLDCAISTAEGYGFQISGRTAGAVFSASRRSAGPDGSELQDALVWSLGGSDDKPQLEVRGQTYVVRREPGTPTTLSALLTPSSDAIRAAHDVERACNS